MSASVWLLSLSLLFSPAVFAEDDEGAPLRGEDVLARYLEASRFQQEKMRGVTMNVDISATLPKMKKDGKLHALRMISRLGSITYDALKFEGDNTVKKEVIARFLKEETELDDKKAPPPLTPENYKFKFKGLGERNGKPVYVFQISPKKKKPGTFKGELWLDPETFLAVRETGRLTKNPSVFIQRFDFVRTYEIVDGMAVPKQTLGVVKTRLWGHAEMLIDYSNFHRMAGVQPAGVVTENGRTQVCCVQAWCP